MKILEISEYYFGLSGILVLNKSRLASIKTFVQNVFCVLLMGPFLSETAGAFIYYHHRDRFENCVQSLAGICAGISVTGKYLSLKLNENQINKLIEKFQETVDEAPVEIRKLYFEAETKGRRLTKYAVKTMLLSFVVIFGVSSLISAFYNIKAGRLDTREWFQVLYIVIPYERHDVPGYFLKQIIVLVICYEYVMMLTPSVTFLMNCHGLFEVGFSHIKSLFVEMDELAQGNPQSNSQEIKIRMIRVVELHIRLLDLAKLLSKIMSGPMFFQLVCNVGLASTCLNLVEIDEFDLDTIQALVVAISAIFWVSLYCYFATRISTMLEQIGDVGYQSQWYNYSIEMRKCVILIIRRAQVPVRFTGLKVFDCDMIVFAAILRLICSYYLMLQKINGD